MNINSKLPEIHKAAFTKAREALGLSTKDLAVQACLSNRQIEQLENGEHSSFYSPQIKVTAAKKVAHLLSLEDKDAFISEPQAGVEADNKKVKEVEAIKEAPKQEVPIPIAPPTLEPIPAISKKVAPPKNLATLVSPMTSSILGSTKTISQKRWILWLSLGAAAAFSIINLQTLFFHDQAPEIIVVKEELIELAPAPQEPPTPDVAPVAVVPPVSIPVVISSDIAQACPVEDPDFINYKPEAPRKSADLVYVQAKSKQVVCVSDGTGKSQNKLIEAGAGTSFYGKPPFKVLTGGLNQVDVYFQGAKVRLANLNTKTVILEPAELVIPTTQADSELR